MKKEEKTKITCEKIITLAIEEFGKYGYDGASLNHICEKGISKGLIYHNFENKDAIYFVCVERCFQEFTNFLQKNVISKNLQSYMDARIRFFKLNPHFATIFFEAILKGSKDFRDKIKLIRKEFDAFNEEFYESIIDSIPLRQSVTKKEAMSYFKLIQTMFNGYFTSNECPNKDFVEIIDHHESELSKILEFILYGIVERK